MTGEMSVGRGRSILAPAQWERLSQSLGLSGRERQIVECMFDDQTEAGIARELGISPHTVHTHLERLHRKLDVASRGALIVRVFAEYLSLESGNRGAP